MDIKNNPIGFFDSGVGGLSVMRESIAIMPNENYIYFGDSKNAPYGTKSLEEVRKLTFDAVEFLLMKNVKAIVIACNTATSAAIEDLRNKYTDIPIIGIEPAIKPAISLNKEGNIIVMATPMTLRENKFKELMNKLDDKGNLVPLPCAGLVEYIEQGILEGDDLESYLKEKLNPYLNPKIASVVLGCTHYPFVKRTISKVLGDDVAIIDGGHGTSLELKRKLKDKGELNDSKEKGKIEIYNYNNDSKVIDFCYNLINTK